MFTIQVLFICLFSQVFTFTQENKKIEDCLRNIRHKSRGSDETYFTNCKIKLEYDFIVIGAGAAGSVVTNRLTEISSWSVLLVEAGDEETILFDVPFNSLYAQGTTYDWQYTTEPSDNYCTAYVENKCYWSIGKSLGGSTAINAMLYTRGHKADYDNWEKAGNTGWGYNDILKYFLKSENNSIQELQNSPFHSTGGYLNVERPRYRTKISEAFLEAGVELGYPSADFNNGSLPLSYSLISATTENGNRDSGSKAFLRPAKNRLNLDISLQTTVLKIIIDVNTKIAVGVEMIRDGELYVVRAKKEVILCAGGLNSPKILMLSGIGPSHHLNQLGIPVIADLCVGENLQDHTIFRGLAFLIDTTGDTVNIGAAQDKQNKTLWLTKGEGPLTVDVGREGLAYVRTHINDDPEGRPDIEFIFQSSSRANDVSGDDARISMIQEDIYRQYFRNDENKESFSILVEHLRPRSRGILKLKSNKPCDAPHLIANYFEHEKDLDALVAGVKIAIKVGQTKAFRKYGTKRLRNTMPGCADKQMDSDDYWKCVIRRLATTDYHYSGTCKMGPKTDPTAVVSPRLQIHGIKRLRVVDTSIIPTIPTSHTAAPAYMIAEKASDMIKEDWEIEDSFESEDCTFCVE